MFKPLRRGDKLMDEAETLALLLRGQEGVLATYGENGYPYAIAVNYVFHQGKIYLHSAKTGLKLDNIRHHHKVCFTVFDHVEIKGDDLTTHYQSAVIFGTARVVPTTVEILMMLAQKYSAMDPKQARRNIDKDFDHTAILEITIDHLSGKIGNK